MPGTNALAYYEHSKMTTDGSFITFVPGVLLQRVDRCDVIGGYPADGSGHVVSLAPLAGLVVAQDSNLQ